MKLVVTVYEESTRDVLDAIRAIRLEHDWVEVRAERIADLDLHALRAATSKPILLTYRGGRVSDAAAALNAGIDYIDVEWSDGVQIEFPERTVLSHHDYEGMRDADLIMDRMRARGCAYTKLAVTPQHHDDNVRLLSLLPGTVIGMGERGMYSRILAPFRGSELAFVAASRVAAPGQLTLERAHAIYGGTASRADKVFAVTGNPIGHSLSPSIHNALFREKGVSAAYTIASVERFAEIATAFREGEPCGLSVTTPFKDDAFAFARALNADLGENAIRARAVNTLVNLDGRILADNTDVDGFAALLPRGAQEAAILGAGGTARAAKVACESAGIPALMYNRTVKRGDAPLAALAMFEGDLVINTLPADADVRIPPCRVYIEAAYGGAPRVVDAQQRIDGLALLHAQAKRQHELFMKVFSERRRPAG